MKSNYADEDNDFLYSLRKEMARSKKSEQRPTLSTSLCKMNLSSPLILASGILGSSGLSLNMIAKQEGIGAVTSKSISLKPKTGYPSPCVLPLKYGILNAIGLKNLGIRASIENIKGFKQSSSVPLILSIFGKDVDEFLEIVSIIMNKCIPNMIELNLSCPNTQSVPIATDLKLTAQIVGRTKKKLLSFKNKVPLSVKLTANCLNISQIAKICEKEGADCITAINTVGPGMIIDIFKKKPFLSNKIGGLSGPAIFPIALRCVYEIFKTVKIPIIATGGVSSAQDVLQMIMAGATAVGIGSAIHFSGIDIFNKIASDLFGYLEEEKILSLSKIRGMAHH